MNQTALLGPGGIVFLGLYILSLIIIGYLGRRARKENSLADFYLAGRGMGLLVLFLTLYATQYSGNTLVGFSARAYREGYHALVLVTLLSAAVGAFLVYAPKLHRLSKEQKSNSFQKENTTKTLIFFPFLFTHQSRKLTSLCCNPE
ncbi:MAG: hypothetical protein QF847_01995 [Candidatus Marinimicrobia bacterium]|nr:hypothetical protein [Candidatus Neomarinimicrobiota bacterium]